MKKIVFYVTASLIIIFSTNLYSQSPKFLSNRITVEGIYKRNLGNFSDISENTHNIQSPSSIALPSTKLLTKRSLLSRNSCGVPRK